MADRLADHFGSPRLLFHSGILMIRRVRISPRDSSAAPIVASALFDLSALHPDTEAGADWPSQQDLTSRESI